MSLFPAYIADSKSAEPTGTPATTTSEWLENASFPLEEEDLKKVQNEQQQRPIELDNSDSDSSLAYDDDDAEEKQATTSNERQHRKRDHKEKQHAEKDKKRKRIKDKTQDVPATKQLEFQGNEEYYVDKLPAKHYKTITELQKPACPRYRKWGRRLMGHLTYWHSAGGGKQKTKRYYRHKSDVTSTHSVQAMSENEFTEEVGCLNRRTMEEPQSVTHWLALIQLQERNPYRLSKLLVAERKLDIIQKAFLHHAKNNALYLQYIDIINETYPSYEVTKLLNRLLSKDPYSYTLWTAQILATQGSMARCIVPDVLQIYERCMQKMHHAGQFEGAAVSAAAIEVGGGDDVMLQLFNNCALFLRQSGLYEQFFALVNLALELNVSTTKFEPLTQLDSEAATLIEYEELILQSGLPMNEIWLRIEKLRQAYNFLPFPTTAAAGAQQTTQCSDPQRIVFNEDVCHYIYPLKLRENSFYLILLVLRLLKLPFIACDLLAEKFAARVQHIGDSDAIEDALAVCVRTNFLAPASTQFVSSVYELSREMAVAPTFLSNSIGHEIYTRCVTQLLLNCASAYEDSAADARKRLVLLLLWCRLQRLLLLLQKYANKLEPAFVQAGRALFKALLKQPQNRNCINLYIEFALYEYEALEETPATAALQKVRSIFENVLAAHSLPTEQTLNSDICNAHVTYAEILTTHGLRTEALSVLVNYILQLKKPQTEVAPHQQLAALQTISKKLDALLAIERTVELMLLEQHFLPDYTLTLLRMRLLLQLLLGQHLEALTYLEQLLGSFRKTNERQSFMREQIYVLYLTLLQQKQTLGGCAPALCAAKVSAALNEFPRNLYFLQCCGTLIAMPWYRVRATMLRGNPSVMSVVLLIATARYRFRHNVSADHSFGVVYASDMRHNESIVRNRILNMFKCLTGGGSGAAVGDATTKYSALRRNALFWSLYLCCLADQTTAFETTKKCLLCALDECPWSKALYMDGATYVPQELPHLQDLIIEKHMRMCALPDELEILREK